MCIPDSRRQEYLIDSGEVCPAYFYRKIIPLEKPTPAEFDSAGAELIDGGDLSAELAGYRLTAETCTRREWVTASD